MGGGQKMNILRKCEDVFKPATSLDLAKRREAEMNNDIAAMARVNANHQREYKGDKCPFCGYEIDPDVYYDNNHEWLMEIEKTRKCNECSKRWIEVFNLVEVKIDPTQDYGDL